MNDTYSITLGYNGAPFAGFARQPGQRTVQGELEQALGLIFRHPIEVTCAGRTDAGVHARGQVVSFDVSAELMEERGEHAFLRSINALTSDGISVRTVQKRPAGFSARFDAKARKYRYFLCIEKSAPIFTDGFSWHVPHELDIDAMREASCFLIGEHDFKSFCVAASAEGRSTYRDVQEISFEPQRIMDEQMLVINVAGNAFLHSMVRTIVGTLVMVGRGKRASEWVRTVLEARDRSAAGENAPAKGLVLWDVIY